MRVLVIFLFLLSSLLAYVTELYDDTFDSFIAKNPMVLVLYYASWCTHCQKLIPEFLKASELIEKQGKPYKLAKIEMGSQERIKIRYGIATYPMTKLFLYSDPQYDYDPDYNAESIVRFIDQSTLPPIKELLTEAELQTAIELPDSARRQLKCLIFTDDVLNVISSLAEIVKKKELADAYSFFYGSIALGKQMKRPEKEVLLEPTKETQKRFYIFIYKEFDDPVSVFTEEYQAGIFSCCKYAK